MEQRLDELELRYTEQQRLMEELSQVVFTQQRELDLVKSELTMMRRKLAELEPGLVDASRTEKPPHY